MPQAPKLTGQDSIDFRIALFHAAEAAGIADGAAVKFTFSAKRDGLSGVSVYDLIIEDVPVKVDEEIEWAEPPAAV